ncbi:MAG TPA: type IIL restriction-modification enzyme MmeI [Candidatus Deferrimicrobiaceae bacterium]
MLDARAAHPGATLADLYDPLAMPPDLVKAHAALDRAVDAAYGKRSFPSEADRVAFLFERYRELVGALPAPAPKKPARRRKPGPVVP